jgi:hypothetical protein
VRDLWIYDGRVARIVYRYPFQRFVELEWVYGGGRSVVSIEQLYEKGELLMKGNE